jgi:hypothetical protein
MSQIFMQNGSSKFILSSLDHSQWRSQTFMQNNSSKLTLLSLDCLANEFLKTFYIRLAIFISISFKYLFNIYLLKIVKEYSHNDPLKSGRSFGKKRKQVRETIKSKIAPLKSAATYSFFLLLIQCGGFFTNFISYF